MIGRTNAGSGGKKPYGFLLVNYPSGATLTCTNVIGKKDISSTQRLYYVDMPASGTSISCVATISQSGQISRAATATFTAEGQSQTVTLAFEYVLVDNGTVEVTPIQSKPSGGAGTYTYDMTTGAKVSCASGSKTKYCMYWEIDNTDTGYTSLDFSFAYQNGSSVRSAWDISTVLDGNYTSNNALQNELTTASQSGTDSVHYDISAYTGVFYLRFGFYSGGGGSTAWLNLTDVRLS